MKGKTILMDIDGCIATEEKTFERALAQPKQDIINIVNRWYDDGNTIILYTARTWAEFKMTKNWLKMNKVKYHQLLCGKPVVDYIVDDRAVNINDIDELVK